jgi:SAM-dependent methyltransferase
LWAPRVPLDQAGFAIWSRQPNWRVTSDRRRVFVAAVREAVDQARARQPDRPVRVLDIGCGWGIGDDRVTGPQFLVGIRERADELHGVEPDPTVEPTHGLFDRFQHALLEDADLPAGGFDVAYAYYVVEHIDDPARFLQAVSRLLRPGGTFVFMTPNGKHWFSRLTRLLRRLRVDETALRLARGRSTVDGYHYPVRHRLNDPDAIRVHAHSNGFAGVDFCWFDHGDVLPYIPVPFRSAADRWSHIFEARSESLVCLLARLHRAP